MRKITKQMAKAFLEGKVCSKGNTKVVHDPVQHEVRLKLFENVIAKYTTIYPYSRKVHITTAGYPSRTTLDRLNAITASVIRIKKGELYLDDEIWDGTWRSVKPRMDYD